MMAHASVFSAPFSVIGPQFIDPKPLEITVEKFASRNIVITNKNNKILLKVKPHDTSLHRQIIMFDANDNPIATFREKILSMHSKWHVFKGESKAESDIIFSTHSEHMVQFKVNVSVTLGNKTHTDDHCDLRIKGSWSKGNCIIYKGDSSTIIAKMHKLQKKHATDKFTVTIEANMDYACVVALFAIVDAMENHEELRNSSGGASGGVLNIASAIITSSVV
ncbi:hypothetical protein QVD17_28087 [Tagetes erecta]|uniref:Uncharacterized protein n=1 Tax=Tagetes erecta TaxID=13708 RepID=A0AAD8KA52_TARER|nr:hypothetical protein QVD17_28087 [Tagetes erecta]